MSRLGEQESTIGYLDAARTSESANAGYAKIRVAQHTMPVREQCRILLLSEFGTLRDLS